MIPCTDVTSRHARKRIIFDLKLARLRHLMQLRRQRVYQGARTNCRWHEKKHSH